MVVYDDGKPFAVMGQHIKLYSEDLDYGRNTVADMGSYFHYLGNEFPGIAAAILAWQEVNGRDLTNEELKQVMADNQLISEAI